LPAPRNWATARADPLRRAVVVGLRPAGLALARGLGRTGVPVAGIAFDRADFGASSRYVTHCRRLPGTDTDGLDDLVLDELTRLAAGGRRVVFPEIDLPVDLLLRRFEAVRELADLPLPDDPELVRRLAAKDLLVEEAARAGIATPRTVAPASEEDVRGAGLKHPLLVKPVASEAYARRFGHKLVRAESVDEAVAAWRAAADAGYAMVLQEEVAAPDRVFSLFTYVGRGGRPLASVVGRKVRQIPRRYGTATVLRTEDEPRVFDLGQRLLSSVGYRGFAHVELIHDVEADSFLLLEVNTRVPVWCGIAVTPDWNMARLAYDDLIGEETEELGVLPAGRTWIYGVKDAWVAAQLALTRESGPADLIGPYRGGSRIRAVWAADDPKPALAIADWAGRVGVRRLTRLAGTVRARGRSR
jgi:predicted ATP-grasp superfamily ATP-dependent carboligase